MKIDPYKHKERYLKWKEKINGRIPEVNKENSDLILQYVGDIDSFEKEALTFNINIPSDFNEGEYKITFQVLDEDNDVYESEDDDQAEFSKTLNIQCNNSINLEQRVEELEQKIEELEDKVSFLERTVRRIVEFLRKNL